ncbi:MAG: hypothetical protein ACJAVZ_003047 [Afipia broomeae]|jgi:hypothetical protein
MKLYSCAQKWPKPPIANIRLSDIRNMGSPKSAVEAEAASLFLSPSECQCLINVSLSADVYCVPGLVSSGGVCGSPTMLTGSFR